MSNSRSLRRGIYHNFKKKGWIRAWFHNKVWNIVFYISVLIVTILMIFKTLSAD